MESIANAASLIAALNVEAATVTLSAPVPASVTNTANDPVELTVSEPVAASELTALNVEAATDTVSVPTPNSVAKALNVEAATEALSVRVAASEILFRNTASAATVSAPVAASSTALSKLCPLLGRAANGASANADVPNTRVSPYQAEARLNV